MSVSSMMVSNDWGMHISSLLGCITVLEIKDKFRATMSHDSRFDLGRERLYMAIDVKRRTDVSTLVDSASLQLFSACPRTNKEGKHREYFVMIMYLYTAHITWSHGGLQFFCGVRSDVKMYIKGVTNSRYQSIF